ncbi:Uncharacterised protein [Mycobacteroides abscessus subsp. massiliense]|nr:Uncharacterised protein [Mycobacteroides abscessus subsp. massiliense]
MNAGSVAAVRDFEVYVLMTMKLRLSMLQKYSELEHKLSQHHLSVEDGTRIHGRVVEALGDEQGYFFNLKTFLDVPSDRDRSLTFSSILWPEYDFEMTADEIGRVSSAQYRHVRGSSPQVESPVDMSVWSMDVDQFASRFSPLTYGDLRPLSDQYLPSYAEHRFEWNGSNYGAGFSWGLFIFAAKSWPED